jgi:uncharacterized protein YodC (DUF2158 family)
MAEFSKGDIVQLLSGGPNMTVQSVTPIPGETVSVWVRCQWFDGNKLLNESFLSDSLKKVESTDKTEDYDGPGRQQDL